MTDLSDETGRTATAGGIHAEVGAPSNTGDERPARRPPTPAAWCAGLFVVTVVVWAVHVLRREILLDFVGDEAGRLVLSYSTSDPASVVERVFDLDSWRRLHPPGDAALKGLYSWMMGPFVDAPGDYVLAHQVFALVTVVGGIVFMAMGLGQRVGRFPAALFAVVASASVPVVYVAHHMVGEAPATLFGGVAAWAVLRSPVVSRRDAVIAAVALICCGALRPEGAAVFGTLAVLPLMRRQWKVAVGLAASAVSAAVFTTLLIELSRLPESYATIRRFPTRPFVEVVTDDRMSELLWGLGLYPFLGVALAGLAVWSLHRRQALDGVALAAGWCAWAVIFTSQIAVGAIHQQERAYVFPAYLGLLAAALMVAPLGQRTARWDRSRVVFAVAATVLAVMSLSSTVSSTYPAWARRVPGPAIEVADYIEANFESGDTILADWLWWQEWRIVAHAVVPGLPDEYCTRYRCPVSNETEDLTDPSFVTGHADRTARAATFLREQQPRFVLVMTDEHLVRWNEYSDGRQPSFVRPQFHVEGSCWSLVPEVGEGTWCETLRNGSYLVLERVDGNLDAAVSASPA